MSPAKSLLVAWILFTGILAQANAQTVKSGTIVGKSVKWTKGSVSIKAVDVGFEIHFSANFETKRGPSLWVFLGNDHPQKKIGRLKSVAGRQIYKIPKSVNPHDYAKLFIHCVPFNATFGVAHLQ